MIEPLPAGDLVRGRFNDVFVTTTAAGDHAGKILRITRSPDPQLGEYLLPEIRASVAAGRLGVGPEVYLRESAALTDEGLSVLVMERFGRPLNLIDPQALSAAERGTILRNTAEQLAEAHRNNLIHGDLHGGNLLVDPAGDVRFIDFGRSGRRMNSSDWTPGQSGSRIEYDLDSLLEQAERLRPDGVDADAWWAGAAVRYVDTLQHGGHPAAPPGTATPGAIAAHEAKIERAEVYMENILRERDWFNDMQPPR